MREQLEHGDSRVTEPLINGVGCEERDCVDDVEWRPANEELQHDDDEHF